MINLPDLQVGGIYKLHARNFSIGVWSGQVFIGIRHKFKSVYLDREFHRDSDPNFGTATPTEKIGQVPEGTTLSTGSASLAKVLREIPDV